MAILSTLLAVSEPSGMWVSIIKAFEGIANTYILAIILLTVIIRLIWAPIDTLNKRMSQKMSITQAKMAPELNKLKEKYGHNPQLFKQKQNELYKKYNGNTMGSCLFMLVFLALNLTIFLTLWSGLNSMAAFKISENYENLKYEYANCLDVTKNYLALDENNKDIFTDYSKLSFEIFDKEITGEDGTIKKVEHIALKHADQEVYLFEQEYKTDYSAKTVVDDKEVTLEPNVYITELIKTLITPESEVVLIPEATENDEIITQKLTLGEAVQNVAMEKVKLEYKATKEKFLWIENIWIADSPFEKSIFTFNSFKGKVGAKNLGENEEFIYNSFMKDLRSSSSRVNGYFILPIICVLASFLTMFLSTRKQKKNAPAAQAQPGGKAMQYIMPIIFGAFALFYNAVFAIYMVVGQIISALLIPLQNLILDKWQKHTDKKKQEKVEVADYSRKF